MTVFIQYKEPRKVPRRRIIPNMGVLGKQYRTKAKAIFAALATATPDSREPTWSWTGRRSTYRPTCSRSGTRS